MKKSVAEVLAMLLAVIVLVTTALLSVWYGGTAALADANALKSRWLVNQWRDGKGAVYSLPLWQSTYDDLQSALRLTPDNAQLMDDLGFLDAARAVGMGYPAVGSAEHTQQQTLFANAVNWYRAATVVRPTFPYTWAYLALAKHLKGEADAELWLAFDKAVQYGRNEPSVQTAIARVAFAKWNDLAVERKNQITNMIDTARPAPRKDLVDIATENGVVLVD